MSGIVRAFSPHCGWVLGACLELGGCGGGGGGASTPAPAPAPPPPASEQALQLTSQNYADVANRLAGYPELGLMAAQLAKDWSEALVASHGASVTLPCDGGGTLSLQLVGKDSSGAPSPGDQVSATLNQCYVRVLDDVFDGTASVDLSAPATGAQWAGVWHFGSHFVTLGSIPIQVEGDVAFETRSDSLSYTVHAFSGVRSLVVSASSGTQVKLADTVTQLDVRLSLIHI